MTPIIELELLIFSMESSVQNSHNLKFDNNLNLTL